MKTRAEGNFFIETKIGPSRRFSSTLTLGSYSGKDSFPMTTIFTEPCSRGGTCLKTTGRWTSICTSGPRRYL